MPRNDTLVSKDVEPIPDSLRTINKIWLEASTSTKRAPSIWNSFCTNLNCRLMLYWQKKINSRKKLIYWKHNYVKKKMMLQEMK